MNCINCGKCLSRGAVKHCFKCYMVVLSTNKNGLKNRTHGLSGELLYDVHRQMKRRCYDPNCKDYKNYGRRGITICAQWLDLATFISWGKSTGHKKGLTIERIDVNGPYSPNNCRWIPNERQALNTRKGRMVAFDGRTMHVSDWAKEFNISNKTLKGRLNRNWPIKLALELRPILGRNQNTGRK